MAGSQLKRLKSSLREQGIVGPQKSKKQKKKAAEEARANGTQDKRLKRSEALASIREQFNPFQFKMNARGPKFPVTSLRAKAEGLGGIKGRPQVALSRSEERRRNTLLVDMQRRNKVGGILDRRLGEGDPNMTPEERALERFAFEKQRMHRKKGAMFDLEDDDGFGDGEGLTHMGRSLALDDDGAGDDAAGVHGKRGRSDDFEEEDLVDDDDDDDDEVSYKKKRKRMLDGDYDGFGAAAADGLPRGDGDADGAGGPPGRKKTKKEVMEEVIAKSKFHKYERQVTREADDDVRAELDKMLPELQQLLATARPSASAAGAAAAAAAGTKKTALPIDKDALEKAYDVRLRQMLQDQKAEPSTRTKTEEELAAEQSAHLKKLEESRVKRMLGQLDEQQLEEEAAEAEAEAEAAEAAKKQKQKESSGSNSSNHADGPALQILRADADEEDDEFQLGKGIRARPTAAELGFDDEDDFLIDDDLVASGSDLDEDEDSDEEGSSGGEGSDREDNVDADADADDDDDEFTKGLLTEEEKRDPAFAAKTGTKGNDDDGVPYTFPCPASHAEFLELVRAVPVAKLPVVVQRIRALYHPKLDHGNKARLGRFAGVLVEHMAYLADGPAAPYATIESLARHVHSLAKTVPVDVANAFRAHLAAAAAGGRALALTRGDLAVLAAVALFPTSDHFHQAVTPAQLAMARYLAHKIPHGLADYATGLYVCTLLVQFQQRSRRYVPELVNYLVNALLALAPAPCTDAATLRLLAGCLPVHASSPAVRLTSSTSTPDDAAPLRKLRPADCVKEEDDDDGDNDDGDNDDDDRKAALLHTALALVSEATALWADKAALFETLAPVAAVLQHVRATALPRAALRQAADSAAAQVAAAQAAATRARRPLALHGWRPLAIRTAVPRFEDEFDPDKHYDPNRERAEAAKLQAEYRRERKGALRELRKDAGFLAREKLKAKKARDAAYEKKYKRLVAEIQGSEGQEANAYERQRQARKRK